MVEYLCWSSTVTYILKRRKQISKKSILITVQEELEDGLPVSIPREGSSRLPDVCFKFDACSTGQHFNISKWAFFTLNLELLYEYVVNCFSCVWLFMTSWTPRVPPGYSVMEFSRQEYWSGLPCPPPGDLPYPGIKSASPALIGGFFFLPPASPEKPLYVSGTLIFVVFTQGDTSWSPGSGGQMSLYSWSCVAVIFRVTQKEAQGLPRQCSGKGSAC